MRTQNELRKRGVKKTSILQFIKDNSESSPSSQDVSNLVCKLKARDARDGPSTPEKRFKKWMK
ncbi:hypothetical protein L914_21454 [Phytophthora nicotianae]|uniref:Uncharacterized protein n=1 Tax=Phytophthora nicotianae TaxID=4792 RepID=W2M3K7_PHYNI|nr:hypothetical protein L914_21454 [Phytophthora nicotianae]